MILAACKGTSAKPVPVLALGGAGQCDGAVDDGHVVHATIDANGVCSFTYNFWHGPSSDQMNGVTAQIYIAKSGQIGDGENGTGTVIHLPGDNVNFIPNDARIYIDFSKMKDFQVTDAGMGNSDIEFQWNDGTSTTVRVQSSYGIGAADDVPGFAINFNGYDILIQPTMGMGGAVPALQSTSYVEEIINILRQTWNACQQAGMSDAVTMETVAAELARATGATVSYAAAA